MALIKGSYRVEGVARIQRAESAAVARETAEDLAEQVGLSNEIIDEILVEERALLLVAEREDPGACQECGADNAPGTDLCRGCHDAYGLD